MITSYDYTAPISEAGDITPTYKAIRNWIQSLKDWPTPPLDIPPNNRYLHKISFNCQFKYLA